MTVASALGARALERRRGFADRVPDARERCRYSTRVPEPVVHRVVIKTPFAS